MKLQAQQSDTVTFPLGDPKSRQDPWERASREERPALAVW